MGQVLRGQVDLYLVFVMRQHGVFDNVNTRDLDFWIPLGIEINEFFVLRVEIVEVVTKVYLDVLFDLLLCLVVH